MMVAADGKSKQRKVDMVCTMQVPDIGFQGYPLYSDKALCAGELSFS